MDRRTFLSLSGATLLHGPLAEGEAPQRAATSAVKPYRPSDKVNIVMLMADQHRWDCMGAYGSKAIHTPNMDRIAREGVVFENAYSSTPSCTPARSALMTGRSPWGHGMLGYGTIATNPYPTEKAAAMAKAGYYTTSVGKNHYYPITNPHGYHHLVSDEHCSYWFHKGEGKHAQSAEPRCDYESWFWSQMPDKDPHATGLGWNDRSSKPFAYPEEMHATHWTGETAVRFLQQYERDEPFFLKVSFIRPHSPYDAPERLFRMYERDLPKAAVGDWAKKYEPHSSERDDLWHGKFSDAEIHSSRQGYYAGVSFVDEQIGRILRVLEQRDMLDNTMIVYFSDHGDMLGDHNMWRKSYAYESSAHIPMLVRPAKSQQLQVAGKRMSQVVEIRDLLPTFLDAAGAAIPEDVEGKSLLELLRGKTEWREYLDLEHAITYDPSNHWTALTDGKWKYIFHCYDGTEQLFHLAEDRAELHDLSAEAAHAETLAMWRARMVKHLEVRGPHWVQDGKPAIRKGNDLYSPNFPGYSKEIPLLSWAG